MKTLKPRTNLPRKTVEALGELYSILKAPTVILKLTDEILTRQESQAVGDAGIHTPALPADWVTPITILRVVARHRGLTLERALLDLCRSLDLIGIGRYELLRKAIGEPVVPERHDVPQWNVDAGELRYKGRVVRSVSPKATNVKQILGAFEEDGWPPRIDDPLSYEKTSSNLREAVRTLNTGLLAIKFFCDGTGEGILWQEVS